MSSILRIRWAIVPKTAPRPLINCNRCGGLKAYHSSGKFRVNANGKRIDAWLIYRCIDCDNSWNFGILERRNRCDIEPELLRALESNDPTLARRHAFDVVALRSAIGRVEEFHEATVHKEMLGDRPENTTAVELQLGLEMPTALRLDCSPANSASHDRGFTLGGRSGGWSSIRTMPKPCARRPERERRSASVWPASPPGKPSSRLPADEAKGREHCSLTR